MNAQPNQDDVAAFMASLKFKWIEPEIFDGDGYWLLVSDDGVGAVVYKEQAQFWYTTLQQSNRQLLDEVLKALPEVPYMHDSMHHGLLTNRAAKYVTLEDVHLAIQAIKERRGL